MWPEESERAHNNDTVQIQTLLVKYFASGVKKIKMTLNKNRKKQAIFSCFFPVFFGGGIFLYNVFIYNVHTMYLYTMYLYTMYLYTMYLYTKYLTIFQGGLAAQRGATASEVKLTERSGGL